MFTGQSLSISVDTYKDMFLLIVTFKEKEY